MAARGCRIGEESRSTFWLRRRVIIAAPEDDDVLEIVNGAAHDVLKLEISRPVAGDVSLGNERDSIFVPARSQMAVLTQEAEAGSGIERRARRGETTLRQGKHRGDDRVGFGPLQNPVARNRQEQYR